MPTTAEILAVERDNTSRIYLYPEGLFLKAYQRSAYLFIRNCGAVKPTKKMIKAVGCEVVHIGFPATSLGKYAGANKITQLEDSRVCIECGDIDMELYDEWFAGIAVKVAQPGTGDRNARTETKTQSQTAVPETNIHTGTEKMLKELLEFRIDNATPMDCMMFIRKIQSDMSNHNCNGDI